MRTGRNFVSALLSLFLPPVAVFLQVGLGLHFWINVLLVFLGFVPAQLHAFWVIASTTHDGREHPEAMSRFLALLVAMFLPPVGVLMRKGLGLAFLVNLVLCCVVWLPGVLHALWVACEDDT
jgi:uncharacterized membrane protein YqaE (UPF0057 family)